MLGVMVFFLSLASFWPLWAAEAKVFPDGCPDLSGTYFCDDWNIYHNDQNGRFQSFKNAKYKDGATLYKIEEYRPDQEAEKETSYLIANGEKIERTTDIWGNKDHAVTKCEDGTLKFYAEVDTHKIWTSWYFKGDILVKKFYQTHRYFGQGVMVDQIYPCKRTDDPEAAAACNNHWCSWEMDQEKADCYKNLCENSASPEGCFNEKCRNDWSKPATPRSTALDRLDEAVEERKTKTDSPHDSAPAP